MIRVDSWFLAELFLGASKSLATVTDDDTSKDFDWTSQLNFRVVQKRSYRSVFLDHMTDKRWTISKRCGERKAINIDPSSLADIGSNRYVHTPFFLPDKYYIPCLHYNSKLGFARRSANLSWYAFTKEINELCHQRRKETNGEFVQIDE